MRTYQADVDGRVQGVCFRAWTREVARMLGVRGYVRNRADGRVRVVAQGDERALERLSRELHRGAPLARVSEVREEYIESEEVFRNFEVRY